MSVEVYGECRAQISSIAGKNTSFDRCLIELRQHDIGDYALRIINLNDRNSELGNWRLVRRDQYRFGASVDQPDTIDGTAEQCRLWLNNKSRDHFHQILRTCLEEFLIVKRDDPHISSQSLNQRKSRGFLEELSGQENQPYYRNDEKFDCIICMGDVDPGEGILFRHCLHPLCRQCLLQAIETSTEATIKCPHENCSMVIDERELRGVVKDLKADQKVVDRLHDLGIRFAESRNKTFHCVTPDCTHWWFIEPEANEMIFCNGCKHWICLSCSVIHEGQTCREYQDMKLREANESTVQRDTAHLEAMIKNKEAMYCPGCRVIIQKAAGCDWIQCTQCKTEICWPTQGPRWGPKGHGDTSGGCRCRVDNGKLCVPNCQNCH